MLDLINPNEADRLAALHRYDILDTPPEESFDRITRLAKSALQMPIVLVSLVDADRQWFKSRQGLDATETPRNISFCTHAIMQDEPLIIPDALDDSRFRQNPLVTGEPYIRFYIGIPLKTPDGYNIGTLCAVDQQPRELSDEQINLLWDLARLVMDELELREIATTDSLTGAQTRRSFQLDVKREMDRVQRYKRPAAFITFDVDNFKVVNDTYGHAAGDAVLQSLASTCKANLRSVDLFARFGGEEFVILMPETDRSGAMSAAEKLRNIISDTPVVCGDQQVSVTASFGVTVCDPEDGSVESLLMRADEAMYKAKKAGRNRTVFLGGAEFFRMRRQKQFAQVDSHPANQLA
ncbi:MAG: sensor domain-containing diguanylate cyclase [Alphaproteobacteria bacterium]|nr:sensor domain-containing diguanylate cyclase [Alphaproteobacteria bacterium]